VSTKAKPDSSFPRLSFHFVFDEPFFEKGSACQLSETSYQFLLSRGFLFKKGSSGQDPPYQTIYIDFLNNIYIKVSKNDRKKNIYKRSKRRSNL